jgi:carboxymethylenebutenolidase
MPIQTLRKVDFCLGERVKGSLSEGGRYRRRLCIRVLASIGLFLAFSLQGNQSMSATPLPQQDAQGVNVKTVTYASDGASIAAFVAEPQSSGTHPGLIVIHGNLGLNESIKDVARRFAAAGFVVMAPDLLSRSGGMASLRGPENVAHAIGALSAEQTLKDLKEGFAFLEKYPGVDASRISSIGFDWGGGRSFMLAAAVPELYRAIVFSGRTPDEGLQDIHAPVMANYAQFDFRLTGNAVETDERMKQLGKKFSYYVYPAVYSGFFTDGGTGHNEEAAKVAWTRTLEFLQASQ